MDGFGVLVMCVIFVIAIFALPLNGGRFIVRDDVFAGPALEIPDVGRTPVLTEKRAQPDNVRSVLTEPPDGLSVEQIGYLFRDVRTRYQRVAFLLDLVRQERLAVMLQEGGRRWTWTVRRRGPSRNNAERAMVDRLTQQHAGNVRSWLRRRPTTFGHPEAEALGWVHRRGVLRNRLLAAVVGVVVFAVLVGLISSISRPAGQLSMLLFIFPMLGFAAGAFEPGLPLTAVGTVHRNRCLAFRNYLCGTGEAAQLKPELDEYARYLPHAVAMACAEQWRTRFYHVSLDGAPYLRSGSDMLRPHEVHAALVTLGVGDPEDD